jgi:DNA-binding LacI/PurR family transcriptional regulator
MRLTRDRRRPPTLIDVADKAGVFGQMISNYLTGRNRPRKVNLERIEQAIKELNYRPSAAARSLRLKRSRVLVSAVSTRGTELAA